MKIKKIFFYLFLILISLFSTQVFSDDVNQLILDLDNNDHRVRYKAAKTLEEMGEKALPALDALINALEDKNANVRFSAAKAIGGIGEKALPALDALNNAFEDENTSVKYFAEKAIEKIGQKAFPTLIGKKASPTVDALINELKY